MKILIESHIPFIKGLLEPVAQVEYLEPEEFTPQSVACADALVIRTRTVCNEALLAGSRVQFIGTATIGTDHIDLEYCRNHGITVCNAAGCNAPAVAQYVLATIGHFMQQQGIASPTELTLGIVGVGHVGSIVERFARECGFKVLL
ncbi:MAG: 4-phosphoerythronate dehydrogenase, partial [Muribaculaceae bacterium]|nr:4-phosphoerythronate dehydrogenase [Muribaculaceae bacterium]